VSRSASAVVFASVLALCVFGQVRMLQGGTGIFVSAVWLPFVVPELPPPGTPLVVVHCPGPLDDQVDNPRRPHVFFKLVVWHRERPIRWPAAFRRAQQKHVTDVSEAYGAASLPATRFFFPQRKPGAEPQDEQPK
jgi:hypothetical protein